MQNEGNALLGALWWWQPNHRHGGNSSPVYVATYNFNNSDIYPNVVDSNEDIGEATNAKISGLDRPIDSTLMILEQVYWHSDVFVFYLSSLYIYIYSLLDKMIMDDKHSCNFKNALVLWVLNPRITIIY